MFHPEPCGRVPQSAKRGGRVTSRAALIIAAAGLAAMSANGAEMERSRGTVAYDDVRIDVIAEGAGPLVVLLPSRGRGSEDFDAVAAGIARAGFRVLRPQPRGLGQSTGPMNGLTLHDFAR